MELPSFLVCFVFAKRYDIPTVTAIRVMNKINIKQELIKLQVNSYLPKKTIHIRVPY